MNTNYPSGFLAGCEAEPLHRSGAIQPHGALIVSRDGVITHVSANLGEWLASDLQPAPGSPLPDQLLALSDGAVDDNPGHRQQWRHALEGRQTPLDVVLSRAPDGSLVWELLPDRSEDPAFPRAATSYADTMCATPRDAAELQAARQRLVDAVLAASGFERVMYYLFQDGGDGEVVAEARCGTVYGSYLGLRYPASDIPLVARKLYLLNPWRLIPDATVEPVPVLGLTEQPPDLTYSDLRSVSPVHRIYLGNMGVCASLSLPICVGGQLLALVAAHHHRPQHLDLATLEHLSHLARSHSLALGAFQSQSRMRLIDGLVRRFSPVRAALTSGLDWLALWSQWAPSVMEELQADGINLCWNDQRVSSGIALEDAALAYLDEWFSGQPELLWTCDSLSRALPGFPLSHAAGALALRVPLLHGGNLRLYLTRTEHIHDVSWGGQPAKPVERTDGALTIAPRRSFERWVERRVGYSRSWDHESRLLALRLRDLLIHKA